MAIISINVELKTAVDFLRRIAEALERAYPEPTIREIAEPAGPESLIEYDPDKEWQRQQEEDRQENLGHRFPPRR